MPASAADGFPPIVLFEDEGRSFPIPESPKTREVKFSTNFRNTQHGFTLLEILIATTMTALILATLFWLFTGIVSSSQNASKRAELYQSGRALMDLLCSDIRGLFPLITPEQEIFFVGFGGSSDDDPELTTMDLITTYTLPVGVERSHFLCEVSYKVKKNPTDPLYSLWRRVETPPILPYDEGGRDVPICRMVESFRLEFLYNNDTKHSLSGVVPDAIVLSFTLNLEGESEHFVTMVRPMIRS